MCNGLRYYKKNYETCQTYTFYGFLIHASVIKIQQAHKGVQGRTRFLRLLSFDDKALDKLCELAKFGSSHYDTHIDP